MKATVERAKSMRFTAIAVGISFVNMLFVLIALVCARARRPRVCSSSFPKRPHRHTATVVCVRAQGVPWFAPGGPSQATLLYSVARNSNTGGPYQKAGDPAFALLFLAFVVHLIAVYALYLRWASVASRFPHSATVRKFV